MLAIPWIMIILGFLAFVMKKSKVIDEAKKLIYLGIFIRFFVYLISFKVILPDSQMDAIRFGRQSAQLYNVILHGGPTNFLISGNYAWVLAFIKVMAQSPTSTLLPVFMNIFAYAFSAILIYFSVKLVTGNSEKSIRGVKYFTFFPMDILYSALPLREEFIVFSFVASVFFVIVYIKKNNIVYFGLALVMQFVSTLFQGGNVPLFIPFIIFFILYNKKTKETKISGMRGILIVVLIIGYVVYAIKSGKPLSIDMEGLADKMQETVTDRFGGVEGLGRTGYLGHITITSGNLIPMSLLRTVYFYFTPFIWMVSSPNDIPVLVDAGCFLVLFAGVWGSFQYLKLKLHALYTFGWVYIVTFSITYAIGSSNYGTAMRHRHKVVGVLIIFWAMYQREGATLATMEEQVINEEIKLGVAPAFSSIPIRRSRFQIIIPDSYRSEVNSNIQESSEGFKGYELEAHGREKAYFEQEKKEVEERSLKMSMKSSDILKIILKPKSEMPLSQKVFIVGKLLIQLLMKDILLVIVFWFALTLIGVASIMYLSKPTYTSVGNFTITLNNVPTDTSANTAGSGVQGMLANTVSKAVNGATQGAVPQSAPTNSVVDENMVMSISDINSQILAMISTPKTAQKIIDMSFSDITMTELQSIVKIQGDPKKGVYSVSCKMKGAQNSFEMCQIAMNVVMNSVNNLGDNLTVSVLTPVTVPTKADDSNAQRKHMALWAFLSLVITIVLVLILDARGVLDKKNRSEKKLNNSKFKGNFTVPVNHQNYSMRGSEEESVSFQNNFKANFQRQNTDDDVFLAASETRSSQANSEIHRKNSEDTSRKSDTWMIPNTHYKTLSDVPVLAMIPASKEVSKEQTLFVRDLPFSLMAEQLKQLRTLLFMRYNLNILMVCSAMQGEGKSTIISNLAVLSAFSGKRTLIIDFDIRRPALDKIFDIDSSKGVLSYLNEEEPIFNCIVPTNVKNLHIMPSGSENAIHFDIVNEEKIQEIKRFAEENYDNIFIDVPPILVVGDTLFLVNIFKNCIIVEDSQITSKAASKEVFDRVRFGQAELIGVVKNRVKIKNRQFSYYYRGH